MTNQGEDTVNHKHFIFLSLFSSHTYPNATPKEKVQRKNEEEGKMCENLPHTLQIPIHESHMSPLFEKKKKRKIQYLNQIGS